MNEINNAINSIKSNRETLQYLQGIALGDGIGSILPIEITSSDEQMTRIKLQNLIDFDTDIQPGKLISNQFYNNACLLHQIINDTIWDGDPNENLNSGLYKECLGIDNIIAKNSNFIIDTSNRYGHGIGRLDDIEMAMKLIFSELPYSKSNKDSLFAICYHARMNQIINNKRCIGAGIFLESISEIASNIFSGKFILVPDNGIIERNYTDDESLSQGEYLTNVYIIPLVVNGEQSTYIGIPNYELINWNYDQDKWDVTINSTIEFCVIMKHPELAAVVKNIKYS